MKKIIFALPVLAVSLIFMNCHSSRKATASAPAASSFQKDLLPVIQQNCSPCHIPDKGGNKKAYDNFANVHSDIDEMIRRIELHPGERGFMPFRRQRLEDSTIMVFKKWKQDGLIN